jgi:hypothetical protein
MRYRKLTAEGDMQFGHGSGDFWHNVPDAVGQAIKTRLLLFTGEWFLDTAAGTPWGGFPLSELVVRQGQILGEHTQLSRDMAIKERVLTTEGVTNIANYGSSFDPDARTFRINMVVDTIYGSSLEFTIMPAVAAAVPVPGTASVQYEVVQPQRRPPPPLLARGNRWRSR